jgi:glutathione S-transferase
MKLYDGGRAPNPRRVRVFLAEKGLHVPIEPVDLGALQHKSATFGEINPLHVRRWHAAVAARPSASA